MDRPTPEELEICAKVLLRPYQSFTESDPGYSYELPYVKAVRALVISDCAKKKIFNRVTPEEYLETFYEEQAARGWT